MKKLISTLLALSIVFSSGIAGNLSVSAATPTVTHNLPKTMKIGDSIGDLKDCNLYCHNLKPNQDVMMVTDETYSFGAKGWYGEFNRRTFTYDGSEAGPFESRTDQNGEITYDYLKYNGYFYRPGSLSMQLSVATDETDYFFEKVGSPITITIEEPIITSNAPSTVKVGSSLNFKTTLTNLNVKNKKVSDYAEALAHDKDMNYSIAKPDSDGIPTVHLPIDALFAYQPKVEIIEGKDIVKQSNQDYSNTLSTSETLSFSKAGTVKLKVTYHQINTNGNVLLTGMYDEQTQKEPFQDKRYHPEKIITIKVTGDETKPPVTSDEPTATSSTTATEAPNSTPSESSAISSADSSAATSTETTSDIDNPVTSITDEETGITIDSNSGVLPEGTIVIANQVTDGEQFDTVKEILKDTVEQFSVFNISLENNHQKIQPNGKVSVSIPVPTGYDEKELVIYHISDDGTKTEISSKVDGNYIVFETDHFSTYVVAEKAVSTLSDSTEDSNNLWWLWLIIGIVVIAGAGTAVWYFKFKKISIKN